ncbi:MAG: hypothetical protein JKX84_11345, partial [Flavobacteriales bacterium]|nr:hypothetical protein [Flavobacteriales bacterium]
MRYLTAFILTTFLSTTCFGQEMMIRWDEYRDDWTDLMNTIYAGDINSVNQIISDSADVNKEPTGYRIMTKSAMSVAIYKQDEKSIKILLKTQKVTDLGKHLKLASSKQNVKI